MKKLLFLFILTLLPMLANAQSVLDVQNSGCLNKTRGGDSQEEVQTIVLTKEGSTLSVQLLNYISNCCAEDFNVTSSINRCSDCESDSGNSYVTISVIPVGEECDCTCPFNLSFAIRDLESNSLYLNCWWYHGYIELKEGEPMVMAFINDLYYHILPSINEAEVIKCPNDYTGNLEIPEKVVYNGTEHRVTGIKKKAFSSCDYITSVTIPNSITKIEEATFLDCTGLISVNIPNSVTSIGEHAFYLCKGLTSVSIPNSVTTIHDNAFRDCSSLTSITIPNSVSEIGKGAFSSCSALKSIVIEEGNTVYDSREECNAIIKTNDNELITGCVNTTIPNSVTTISNGAFFNCTELTTITIPNSVTKIGGFAFQNCTSLLSITIPNSVTAIGSGAFSGCQNLLSITIPNSVTAIGSGAFSGCQNLLSVTISNSITTIEDYVFSACRSLTSAIIPNSVTTIGEGAFNACESLTSITIPNSVTSIGSFSFGGCKRLTSINIPNSVTKIGNEAFSYCRGLTSITIPNSVTEIGGSAFRGCSSLTSITIPNSVTSINYDIFRDCSRLTSIDIPNSVTEIGGSAFQDCSSLTSITIPNSVTQISAGAFWNCSGLISVTIGNKVDSIGYGAFAGCKNISDVYCYAKDVPEAKNNTFEDVNIKKVTLHVPAASVSAYQAIEPWKNFKQIVALPAQDDYRPFVVEGRKWNVVTINPAYPSEATNGYYDVLGRRGKVWGRYTYVLEGDTVIGGITYKRLLSDGKYVCGLREEDGRVYKRGNNSEGLLYDFNAQPGDIFKNDEYIWMQVGQVRQVSVKGQDRRCLDMYSYYYLGDPEEGEDVKIMGGYNVADYWIEGIGCTGFPDNAFWWFIIGNYPLLVSVYDGDECIFDIEEFASIVATSVRDIPKATDGRSISPDAPIYDLQGRRLSATPQKGVYIQNGKKIVVK